MSYLSDYLLTRDGAQYTKGAKSTLFESVQLQALLPFLERSGQEHGLWRCIA